MLNIVKVECPHCGIEGQLMLPDSSSLIVGPCPECKQLVVIFGGKALALNTSFMAKASQEEAYKHINDVLSAYVRERIDHLFSMASSFNSAPSLSQRAGNGRNDTASARPALPHITSHEMDTFIAEELRLLDDPHYFRSIFG